ncbi:MAG TPA: type III-B CRISPR module RAMP protein Cmr4 [Polyangiaceae bacterium]|jgi:CRISPR-associated protein Cmr4|nr:MAG: RAMP superfamily protein [Deltaproteobacteria bacterium ADurb.Bin207]HNS99943.1 type III-B CRISPR module RAMP protein Cmr4 [Polyangiaceae bacterium]HNZ24933.1 type III-B CRISPR module RAMP protein Cmr4 [Polyangiaceae bacterium]HOD24645.1 type III-B CRISPR module RAMP protein Cmr4 [Polyangiaceae bacterium]HOE50478.1 type III-B CRISPR module RAMP protein Cmr4 [Polyangiaceae bacterium]
MFEKKAAMFLYCVSPVHMGAGTQLGVIDNPIQRERHTEHPMMAGSGLKGALRHDAQTRWEQSAWVHKLFGPDAKVPEHAGAISFSDAQIVLFPVRSLKQTFVYATCPTALARLQRTLLTAGVVDAQGWKIPELGQDDCVVVDEGKDLLVGDKLILESFQFKNNTKNSTKGMAAWLGQSAMPAEPSYFADKVKKHLVVLHDDRFNYFVRNATVVEAHVRISDESGTADDGGLFYTENLPSESLLLSLGMASRERRKKKEGDDSTSFLSAEEIMAAIIRGDKGREGFDGRLIQVGGDATTGRGQVVLRFVGGGQ